MNPDKRSNFSNIKELIRQDDNEGLEWDLKAGWSNLPPWADYKLLVMAIKHDSDNCVEKLLEKGCRVFKPGCIDTPLHMIAVKEWWDLIDRFLQLGARVSDPNKDGDTIVHLINDSSCSLEIYDLVLRRHQQETTVNVKNRHGMSFLHVACTLKNLNELVRKCLKYNPKDLNCQILRSCPFRPGYTPLHCAVEFNNCEAAKLLLDYGARLDIQNAEGSTPVHFALRKASYFVQRDTAMIDLLMNHYFIMDNIVDNKGLTLLICACAANFSLHNRRFSQSVLIEGINDTDNSLNTPLHIAAKFGRQDAVKLLLQFGAQCCALNDKGFTPLALAQQHGHENVCELLQQHCNCNQTVEG